MTFSNADLVEVMPKLRKFALKLTASTERAEDLLQDTMLKMLEKREMFETGSVLFSWAGKVMFNIFAAQYRRKKKFESQYDPEPVIMRQSVAAPQDMVLFAKQVAEQICKLPGEFQEVILAVAEGGSYEAAAEQLGIPMGTVRSRLNRARQRLDAGDRLVIAREEPNAPAT